MAANTSPIFGLTPVTTGTAFTNATGTTVTAICTAGANGARVLAVNAVTSDTSPNDVNLYVQVGGAGSNFNLGGKRVAAASGDVVASTTPSVSLLDSTQIPTILADGSIQLGASDKLLAGVVAAVTSGKQLTIFVQSINY